MSPAWLIVAVAIVLEVGATLALRVASTGGKWYWYVPTLIGYLGAIFCLSFALQAGLPLGIVYGVWTAIGVALTAALGRVLFKEPLTWVMGLGIAFIMAGVLLVETSVLH